MNILKRKADGDMERVVRQKAVRTWMVETKRKKNTGEKLKLRCPQVLSHP